jgi:hypothetical protein
LADPIDVDDLDADELEPNIIDWDEFGVQRTHDCECGRQRKLATA